MIAFLSIFFDHIHQNINNIRELMKQKANVFYIELNKNNMFLINHGLREEHFPAVHPSFTNVTNKLLECQEQVSATDRILQFLI